MFTFRNILYLGNYSVQRIKSTVPRETKRRVTQRMTRS